MKRVLRDYPPESLSPTLEQRMREKIRVVGDCWEWQGALDKDGYGFVFVGRRARHKIDVWRSHRVAYELWSGPIPGDLELDHLCRNTRCVNPDHLEPVTRRVNSHRSDSPWGINARKTHCSKGHPYTDDNTYIYNGSRHCKACHRENQRRHPRRKDTT